MDSLKIAINTNSQEFKTLGDFFSNIFRTKETYNEPGVKVIQLTPQSLLELHSPGAYSAPFLFSQSDIAIHLGVDNLPEALKTAETLGFSLVEELKNQVETLSFAYIRVREGFILGLYQNIKS
jgi:hypothetical protein